MGVHTQNLIEDGGKGCSRLEKGSRFSNRQSKVHWFAGHSLFYLCCKMERWLVWRLRERV